LQPYSSSGATGSLGTAGNPNVTVTSAVDDEYFGLNQVTVLHRLSTTLGSYLRKNGVQTNQATANTNLVFNADNLIYASIGGDAINLDGTQGSYVGHIPEIILYNDDKFTDYAAIEANQKTAWGTI